MLVGLALLTPLFAASSGGLVYHYTCGRTGAPLAVERLWTPMILVNSPFGGVANATYTVPGVEWSTSAKNGSADGLFSLDNWTVYATGALAVPGPGLNEPCRQSYTALDLRGSSIAGVTLLPVNTTTDAQEPTQISQLDVLTRTVYGSVIFANGYVPGTPTVFDSCGSPGLGLPTQPFRSTALLLQIPYILGNQVVNVSATLPDAVSFTYGFGIAGIWHFTDPNSGEHPSGGGLAFDYAPCSSAG